MPDDYQTTEFYEVQWGRQWIITYIFARCTVHPVTLQTDDVCKLKEVKIRSDAAG